VATPKSNCESPNYSYAGTDTARRDGYVPPCIPTRAYKAPAGPGWVNEIKHDGYRLQVRRDGDTVRLFTRRGYDGAATLNRRHRDAVASEVVHDRWGGNGARGCLKLF
jgi:ATP dependent DNA ligase domain